MVKLGNVHWEKLLLWLWFVINLSIGALTVHEYGISVDETNNYRYANDTLEAYPSFFGILYQPKYDPSYDGHGPAFVTLAIILIRIVQSIFPNVFAPDLWHYSYFITFQLTGLCLYWLTKRWFNKWTSWGILILFTTQPLLWGHAFINPKDIPFMFFFTLSVVFGFRLVDSVKVKERFDSLDSLKTWFAEFFRVIRNPRTILAGLTLGLATAVRPVAPWAGVIVLLYMFIKVRSRAWTTAIAYFLIAGVVTYIAWPHLWGAPIQRYFESLKIASSFPPRGNILFMGEIYGSTQLPRIFFPTLLGLQLTEPALILISIGLVVSPYLFLKGRNLEPILLSVLWFLVPALGIVFLRSTLYDNARQLLFLWPPLFILAGVGIDQLITVIKTPLVRVILMIIMASPGLYASIQLHPYQYVYYNSLIGGVRGAYRNFELDYWDTSFKASMEYLNKNAEQGRTIMVIGSGGNAAGLYARPDLIVIPLKKVKKSETQPYYILASTRWNRDLGHCEDAEMVSFVERAGGILSYVKKIDPGRNCQ